MASKSGIKVGDIVQTNIGIRRLGRVERIMTNGLLRIRFKPRTQRKDRYYIETYGQNAVTKVYL